MLFWLPGLSPAILARGVKSACFAVARGGLPRLAAARHAARAHSWECRARPDVEKTRQGTFTASLMARKSQILSNIGRTATRTVAAGGLPRQTAARHAACARSPGCMPRPDVGGARPAHARASTRGGKWGWWSWEAGWGRPGGPESLFGLRSGCAHLAQPHAWKVVRSRSPIVAPSYVTATAGAL